MAKTKSTKRKAASTTNRPATKKVARAPAGLAAPVQKVLLGLDLAFEAPPDVAVKDVLHEARDLAADTAKIEGVLIAGSELKKGARAELLRREEVCDHAERAWLQVRRVNISEMLIKSRDEAEKQKRSAFSALRYFCRADADVQRRLDGIAEGSGDADLIDDVEKLADLVEENLALLKKADLPKNPVKVLTAARDALADAAAGRAGGVEALTAHKLRNRAFWWLREQLDEVRAAGRYVYRNDPKMLVLFRASTTKVPRGKRKAVVAPSVTPAVPPKP